MIKNIVIVFILTIAILSNSLLPTQPVYADYAGTYRSYVNLYDAYRKAEQSYIASKNKYLTYRTLTAENEALESGRIFLKLRDQLVLLYFQLLYERVKETGGFTIDERTLIFNKLSVEMDWLAEHRTLYDSSSTLKDLQRTSDQMQERYMTLLRYIGLQTAGSILQNKVTVLTTLFEDLLSQTESQIELIAVNGADTTLMQRWLLEAKNKLALSIAKQEDAKAIFTNLHGENLVTDYNTGAFALTEATQYLREANSNVSEILRIIKGE